MQPTKELHLKVFTEHDQPPVNIIGELEIKNLVTKKSEKVWLDGPMAVELIKRLAAMIQDYRPYHGDEKCSNAHCHICRSKH